MYYYFMRSNYNKRRIAVNYQKYRRIAVNDQKHSLDSINESHI